VADHTATFAVKLEDGTSAPALNAAKAFSQLQDTLAADTKALAEMQKAMKNLNAGTSVNIEQANKLRAAMAAKRDAIAQSTAAILELGGSLTRAAPKAAKVEQSIVKIGAAVAKTDPKVDHLGKTMAQTKPKTEKVTSAFEQLTKQANAMPGPLGAILGRFSSLSGLLAGGALAVGVMAVATAVIALTAAMAAAIATLASYGIAQANARRSELLRLEGLTKMRFWYKAAAGSATEMQKVIDQVSDSSSLGRGEITKYTEQLYRMGLRGNNLSEALEGVAIKAATQGDAAANAFAGMAAGAALSGRSIHAMTEKVKTRLGGIAAKKMLDLNVQIEKMRENFDALFRDLKIEGLLTAMREVGKVFSQSTVTGRALKTTIEGVVQVVTDGLADAAPYAKRFFQGMVIGALLLGIVFLQLRKSFRETFGGDSKKGLDGMNLALDAGILLVSMLVAAVAVLAAIAVVLAAPFIALAALVYGLAIAVLAVWDWLKTLDWKAIGSFIIDGILTGLKYGAQLIAPAMTALGTAAWKAFSSVLGIHSPSKVFAELGRAIPEGVAVGVEEGAPTAQSAVESAVGVPKGGGAGGGARGAALSIGELHFHAANDSQPRAMAEDFRRELERVLEGLAISLGAPVPGGAA
jgi:hypothetical protein